MKPVRIHRKIEKDLKSVDVFTRSQIMELLALVAKGASLDYVKLKNAILVFHSFKKKAEKTPTIEIETGKKR